MKKQSQQKDREEMQDQVVFEKIDEHTTRPFDSPFLAQLKQAHDAHEATNAPERDRIIEY